MGVVAPDSAAKGYVKAVTEWFDTDWFKATLTASQEYRIEMLGDAHRHVLHHQGTHHLRHPRLRRQPHRQHRMVPR